LAGICLTAAAAIYGIPWAVAALGFGTAGITANSIAAWMMSLYGGTVPAGSVVAVLQSIGATGGVGSVAKAIVAAVGGIGGIADGSRIIEALSRLINNSEGQKKLVESLSICLLSRCGGKLNAERAASVIDVFTDKGIHAITDKKEKDAVDRCLRVVTAYY